jgi:hypothetical protein
MQESYARLNLTSRVGRRRIDANPKSQSENCDLRSVLPNVVYDYATTEEGNLPLAPSAIDRCTRIRGTRRAHYFP